MSDKIVDAKFKVIHDPNRVRWWQQRYSLSIDWRVVAIVTAVAAAQFGRSVMERQTSLTAPEQAQSDVAP